MITARTSGRPVHAEKKAVTLSLYPEPRLHGGAGGATPVTLDTMAMTSQGLP